MLDYYLLDVFTDQPLSGNPLAVVLDADALPPRRMQAIALEFNLSETVFVCAAQNEGCAARLRIFTPRRELPFAGHPTVGAACLLSELGRAGHPPASQFVLEEGVGPVPVRVSAEPGVPRFAQFTAAQAPEFGPTLPDRSELAAMLGIEEGDIGCGQQQPQAASCGLPFALIPLRAPEVLAGVTIDLARWQRLFAGAWTGQLWLYAPAYESDYRARMFAPGLGVLEDPATGSAAAAFAGALACRSDSRDGTLRWEVEQGLEMGRPSRLYLEADKRDGSVAAVRVGGHAIVVAEGRLRL